MELTTAEAAENIETNSFRDRIGRYLTGSEHSGVLGLRCSIRRRGCELELDEAANADDEPIEDAKGYREWLVPAAMLN